DLTDDIIEAMADIPQVCNALHLPFQAGSNRILALMDRGYTKEEYLEKVYKLKEAVKDIAMSTDVIVGFPTETEEDFEHTLDILEKVKFEQVFSFKFSPRPGTPAAQMQGQIEDKVKTERMKRLLELQKSILAEVAKRYEGTVQEVLVEEEKNGELIGRTTTNKWASFRGDKSLLGKIVKIKVVKSSPFSLEGEFMEVIK
ncbi:MAG TPA: TRAM domain-containing protein, partial [Aquifex aeolicus]|nr:TRAM domain-containing protein [Aquifex aeolicus]